MPDDEQKTNRGIKIEKLLLTGPGESPRGSTWGGQGRVQAESMGQALEHMPFRVHCGSGLGFLSYGPIAQFKQKVSSAGVLGKESRGRYWGGRCCYSQGLLGKSYLDPT